MNQFPCVPQAYPVAAQQPSYNAVKIDIINPANGVQGLTQPQTQPAACAYTAPVYNYPQAPIYNYPAAQPDQQVMPQNAPFPSVATASQPVTTVDPQTMPVPSNVQQYYNGPVQQYPQAPVAQPVPQPQITNQPQVVPGQAPQPMVDLNGFIAKLANPDFEGQATAMEDIANMIKTSPDKATELVDTKIFDSLNNIVHFDSSKLEGPTQEQVDARQKIIDNKQVTDEEKNLANTRAPRELAERNKSYALFTIAMLDKLYADEVAKLSNNVVPLTDLPEAVTIVDQLKDNPNPMVRASAIEALSYLQKPEYNKDLETLFSVAKNDQDQDVAQSATTALEKLAK